MRNILKRFREKNTLELPSKVRLIVSDPKTGEVVEVIESHNIIVTVGKHFIGDMLIDLDADHNTGLTYCAIGSDNTTPVIGDTTLTVEEARKAITSKSRSGKGITLSTFFTAGESTYNIKEAGIFGHASATGSVDTGKLLAHWLVAYDNSGGNYDLTFDYVLTIG